MGTGLPDTESGPSNRSSRRILFRPTPGTLVAFAIVFVIQELLGVIGAGLGLGLFALSLPLTEQPWTLFVSVYAHADLAHLLANAVGVALFAPVVAYTTTSVRFHAFFAGSGALAGVAQVVLTAPFGASHVLGASGAVFALFGYLIVENPVADVTLARLPRRVQLAIVAISAVGLTLLTAAPGIALVAHAVGFVVGAGAGRGRLLAVE